MVAISMRTTDYAYLIHLFADQKTFLDKFLKLLKPTFARVSGLDPNGTHYDFVRKENPYYYLQQP